MTKSARTLPVLAWTVACGLALALLVISGRAGAQNAQPAKPAAGLDAGRTLAEIEPGTPVSPKTTPGSGNVTLRIERPGRYYLVGNVQGTAGHTAIEIAADQVTLDLMGFEVAGAPGALAGIVAKGEHVTVRGGVVRNWPQEGVALKGTGSVLEYVTVRSCGASGAAGAMLGAGGRALHCAFLANNLAGLSANAPGTIVESCVASGNTGVGLVVGEGASVRGCTLGDNKGDALRAGAGSRIEACVVRGGQGAGIVLAAGAAGEGCVVSGVRGAGLTLAPGAQSRDCQVTDVGGVGIDGAGPSAVLTCVVRGATGDGVRVGAGSHVRGCIVSGSGSGQANIRATGKDVRIEDNSCAGAGQGIRADVAGCVIIRNVCSGNSTNYALTGTHTIGPIVTKPGTIPFGAGAAGLSPWANLEH